jgi:hypothetical protein
MDLLKCEIARIENDLNASIWSGRWESNPRPNIWKKIRYKFGTIQECRNKRWFP